MDQSPDVRELEREARSPKKKNGASREPRGATCKHLYLTGRPELRDFIRYVKKNAVNPPPTDELIEEWNAAHNVAEELERSEQGAADNPPIIKLDIGGKHLPFLTEFLKNPMVKNGFNSVPTEIALVQLDRLVVYQKHIDLTHVERLKKEIGPAPSEEVVFKTALPYDPPQTPVKWSSKGGDSFVFVSPSKDLRYLGPMQLKPKHITDYSISGSLVGCPGAAIGFGSNFLNAVYCGNRLILNNGSHRAYALHDLGVTHVPCIVQHVSSMDELDVVATSQIVEKADFFLKHPRPSMLKDYFNPRVRKVFKAHRRVREITVRIIVEETYIPEL
jgi:hypothetical protein